MNNFVGKEFRANNTFPFMEELKSQPKDDRIEHISKNARIKVDSFENGKYKILNLSTPPHWVKVTEEELKKIIG